MHGINLTIRTGFMVAGIALVTACAGSSSRYAIQPSVNPASVVQINRQFEIPENKARVYIQNGIPVTLRNIDRWSTYCSLLMQTVHAGGEPRLGISPGRFNITKVLKFNDLSYFPGVFITSRSWILDPPSNVIYEVEMRLSSDEQPGVRALICAKRVDLYGRYYPSLAEIRIALGNAIEINPPR